ncbi:MAG: hypothetical protein IIX15_05285 [Clostridia bacterium]|nr:hypothetical protein [Clostridia bacterium]
MKLIKIFGEWYVHPDERGGEQPKDTGRWILIFEGAPSGAQACINGKAQLLQAGAVEITAPSARLEIELRLPSGESESVEVLVFNGDKLLPAAIDIEVFMLQLARRIECLEGRVDDEERDIRGIRDKKQGAYFLGGTRK